MYFTEAAISGKVSMGKELRGNVNRWEVVLRKILFEKIKGPETYSPEEYPHGQM